MTMVSTKPYLVRAIYEWCVDQGFTPHIAVLIDERVVVPPGYAQDGQIVLNLGPDATGKLVMGNDTISFHARFGGASHALLIPVDNVLAIYARETGQGMAFETERPTGSDAAQADDAGDGVAAASEPRPADEGETSPTGRGSHLKVVK